MHAVCVEDGQLALNEVQADLQVRLALSSPFQGLPIYFYLSHSICRPFLTPLVSHPQHYKLVLMDNLMPVMNGVQVRPI